MFAAIFADGIQLRVNDAVPGFEIENSRIYARHREPPFGTLAAAKESFQSPTASADLTNSYRGALVFDLILFYPTSDSMIDLSIILVFRVKNPDRP